MTKSSVKCLALVGGGVIFLSSAAYADFINNLPVKWSQPIGTNANVIIGTDRISDHTIPWVMADDFQCTDPNPVMAVRWWGSYVGETVKRPDSAGYTVSFDINFLSSTFPTSSHPNSHPGAWLQGEVVLAQEVFVGIDQTGDFVYRYDAYLPVPFHQVPNTEYFLSIDKPTGENWGWHDSAPPHPALDWAALSIVGDTGPYVTFNPKTDLALEIMVPEPSTTALALIGGGLLLAVALRRRK